MEYLKIFTDFSLSPEQQRGGFPREFRQRLDRLSQHVAASGKVYRDHLAVPRSRARQDAEAAASPPRARASPGKSESADRMRQYLREHAKELHRA